MVAVLGRVSRDLCVPQQGTLGTCISPDLASFTGSRTFPQMASLRCHLPGISGSLCKDTACVSQSPGSSSIRPQHS
jgi:hypothetical protein